MPGSIPEGFTIERRGDMVLIGQAIRGNWQLSQATKQSIVDQLGEILNDHRPRWKLRAIDLLILMDRTNWGVVIPEDSHSTTV